MKFTCLIFSQILFLLSQFSAIYTSETKESTYLSLPAESFAKELQIQKWLPALIANKNGNLQLNSAYADLYALSEEQFHAVNEHIFNFDQAYTQILLDNATFTNNSSWRKKNYSLQSQNTKTKALAICKILENKVLEILDPGQQSVYRLIPFNHREELILDDIKRPAHFNIITSLPYGINYTLSYFHFSEAGNRDNAFTLTDDSIIPYFHKVCRLHFKKSQPRVAYSANQASYVRIENVLNQSQENKPFFYIKTNTLSKLHFELYQFSRNGNIELNDIATYIYQLEPAQIQAINLHLESLCKKLRALFNRGDLKNVRKNDEIISIHFTNIEADFAALFDNYADLVHDELSKTQRILFQSEHISLNRFPKFILRDITSLKISTIHLKAIPGALAGTSHFIIEKEYKEDGYNGQRSTNFDSPYNNAYTFYLSLAHQDNM